MRIRNPNQPGISIGLEVGQLFLMVIVCIPALVVGFFLFPEDGGMDVESPRLAACFVMALGVFVILYRFIGVVGVEKLLELAAWLDRKCDRLNRKLNKNYRSMIPDPAHHCPHCHRGAGPPAGGGHRQLQCLRCATSGNRPGTGYAGDDGLAQFAPLWENSAYRIVFHARSPAVLPDFADHFSE